MSFCSFIKTNISKVAGEFPNESELERSRQTERDKDRQKEIKTDRQIWKNENFVYILDKYCGLAH